MPKITTTHVSHAGTSNTTRISTNSHRGGPVPSQEPAAEPAPVIRLPFAKHQSADGSVSQPSWSPEHIDSNLATSQWSRSWEDTVASPNPAGDPTHPRKQRVNFEQPAEKHAKVSFENSRKIVTYADSEQLPTKPASVLLAKPSRPTRRVVGSRAPLSPAKMSSVFDDSK